MKFNQLFVLLLLGLSTQLTAQVYTDLNVTIAPSYTSAPSPGVSAGYYFNNMIGLGAFAQSQLGSNYLRSDGNINKEAGVYYGLEFKGNTGTSNNTGWTYKGRVGLGNYKYNSYYEGGNLRVNAFYEAFIGKNINRKFALGIGWRQTTETTEVYEWGGISTNSIVLSVFDRIETNTYNDWLLRMTYTIGHTPKSTLQPTKAATLLNRLYLDFFVSKSLNSTNNNNYYYTRRPFDQIEGSIGFKINDNIGIGLSAFMSSNINTFIEEDLLPITNKPASFSGRYANYGGGQGMIGVGLQLRATPGKWYYAAEVGNVARISANRNGFFEEAYLIDFAYYYEPINVKTDGVNPYINLHIGRTLWDFMTISLGYTFVPRVDYTFEQYEGADPIEATMRYHAPQLKVGFTLD